MNPRKHQLAYQEAAVRNATTVELVIILHEVLTRDLQAALTAMAGNDIEARTKAIKHAFLVLAHLENALDMKTGGDTALKLSHFYDLTRAEMLKAHAKKDPGMLRQLIGFVAEMRQAWTAVNSKQAPSDASQPQQSSSTERKPAQAASSSWKA